MKSQEDSDNLAAIGLILVVIALLVARACIGPPGYDRPQAPPESLYH